MNARRLLFSLVMIAGLLILLSSYLAIRQQQVVRQTSGLVQSFSALESWQILASQPQPVLHSLAEQGRLLRQHLPSNFATIDDKVDQWTYFLYEESLGGNALAEAKELEELLVDELLYCHQLQADFGRMLSLMQILLILVVIGIGIVSYFMGRRAQDYRLAPFPEANPNPVFGLNFSGDVIYTNNAAQRSVGHLSKPAADVVSLLPADFRQRLVNLQRKHQLQDEWTHPVGERIFQYRVQLLPALERIHIYSEDVTEKENIRARNAFIAYHDPVSLLANRQRLEQIIDELEQPELFITLVITTVHGLSGVLSTQGVRVADQFTREYSIRLRSAYHLISSINAERKPIVFRFDSNLFGCLYFSRLSDADHKTLMQALQQTVSQPFYHGNREYFLSIQSGVASETATVSARHIIQQANLALHALDSAVEQQYQLYDEQIEAEVLAEQTLEQRLRHAIEFNELLLYYQPQLDLHTGRLLGFEALMRWQRESDMILPGQFIPLAEKTGLIHSMGNWALCEVLKQRQDWRQLQQQAPQTIAVNVSAHEFARRDFIVDVEQALAISGGDADGVQLEITESLLIADEQIAIDKMRRLKDMGFSLAIDDFGTGYSSFSYLSRFPVDKLKIDQSFIANMSDSAGDEAIVAAMIDVAHQLDLKVIAEGVESAQQKQRLQEMGCDQVQGYFYGKPMTAVQATLFMTKQSEEA